jgi:hypothetical protein
MLNPFRTGARAAAGELARFWRERGERIRLAPLYDPDFADLDLSRHVSETIDWLKRAQDAGKDRGVSYGVFFGEDFDVSYPETTGYICSTFVEQEELTRDGEFLSRAIDMGDWEIAVQLPEGAVMGGKLNTSPTPAVFNTGMVLLGWSALISRTREERFRMAATRAADWLLSVQEPNGRWVRGNSKYADPGGTLYNVMAAWGLCEAGAALGDDRYIQAAIRNGEYCLSQQHQNGWLPDCCLTNVEEPLLHTLAYSMQGLLGIGRITGRQDLVAGAQKLADAELRIMSSDGFLPGRQRQDFSAASGWCCLTGSAQTSAVWSQLYLRTRDQKYRSGVELVNRYLMARHDIRNSDSRLRGGLAGSWPVWGDYGRLQILNWATKFLLDALTLEKVIREESGQTAVPSQPQR